MFFVVQVVLALTLQATLMFYSVTSTEVVVIAAKYADVFLLLIYALGYLLCVPPQWYININSIKVYEY